PSTLLRMVCLPRFTREGKGGGARKCNFDFLDPFEPPYEIGDRRNRLCWLVDEWRVSAITQNDRFERRVQALLQSFDLGERAVLIFLALDHEDGDTDIVDHLFDVPSSEGRVEPGPIPAPESAVDILVMFREAVA